MYFTSCTYRLTDILIYRRTDVQTYRRTGVQAYRCTDIQMDSVQTHKCTDIQMCIYSDIEMYSTLISTYLLLL